MLIEQIAPVAENEFAPVFVALELSRSKWLVGVGTPQQWRVRRHEVCGGDLYGLLELLRRVSADEEKRSGLPVKVHVCFEAGRDGHWLHRALKLADYDVYEIEPASVAGRPPGAPGQVGRRGRRQARADPGAPFAGRARRLPGRRGPERSGRRREASTPRVRAARQGTDVPPQSGEGVAVRPRRSRFRPDGAGSAGAPGGVADHAEAEG